MGGECCVSNGDSCLACSHVARNSSNTVDLGLCSAYLKDDCCKSPSKSNQTLILGAGIGGGAALLIIVIVVVVVVTRRRRAHYVQI